MPVLSREPFLAPAELFGDPEFYRSAHGARWFALHTRPRAEKSLARRLFQQSSAAFFLPLYERGVRFQRRLVRSYLPLFPGYLFLFGTQEGRRAALGTRLVANCLDVQNQEGLHRDLMNLHRAMEAGAPLVPEDRLRPGMAAEIIDGPLAGQRGTVVRISSGFKLVVSVDFLQRGASIEVDKSAIRLLT